MRVMIGMRIINDDYSDDLEYLPFGQKHPDGQTFAFSKFGVVRLAPSLQ